MQCKCRLSDVLDTETFIFRLQSGNLALYVLPSQPLSSVVYNNLPAAKR